MNEHSSFMFSQEMIMHSMYFITIILLEKLYSKHNVIRIKMQNTNVMTDL